jgi:hypothetical protein
MPKISIKKDKRHWQIQAKSQDGDRLLRIREKSKRMKKCSSNLVQMPNADFIVEQTTLEEQRI